MVCMLFLNKLEKNMIKNVQVSKIIYQLNYSTANQKVALKNSTFYGLINFLVKF